MRRRGGDDRHGARAHRRLVGARARTGGVGAAVATAGWAATAVVALALAAVAALPATGRRVMVVTGGSMGSALPVGSAAVVVALDDHAGPSVGDVVTFERHGGAGLTTHRVVSTHLVDGVPHLRTRGDANDTPDPDLVPIDAVVGTVEASIPGAGSWLLALSRPWARLVLVAGPAAVVATRQVRVLARAARLARLARVARVATVVAALGVATSTLPATTWTTGTTGAGYADTALAGGASFSTGAFPP